MTRREPSLQDQKKQVFDDRRTKRRRDRGQDERADIDERYTELNEELSYFSDEKNSSVRSHYDKLIEVSEEKGASRMTLVRIRHALESNGDPDNLIAEIESIVGNWEAIYGD